MGRAMNRSHQILLLAVFLIVLIGASLAFSFFGNRATQPGGNLRAQAHTGEVLSLSDMPGDLRLVYFGFMNCPDVCLDAALSIGGALRTLESNDPAARATLTNVFVTLDPDDDVITGTYNELGGYMDSRYGGQGYALRPESRAQARAMATSYGIRFEYVEDSFFPSGYRVDHASLIFLTDRQGRILAYYPDRTPGRVIAQEVQSYWAALKAEST